MKTSKYFHESNRKDALSILKDGLKYIPREIDKKNPLGRIDYRAKLFWAVKLSKHSFIKEYLQSMDENGGETSVIFFFNAPSIGEKGGPRDEHDDGMEGYVSFEPKDFHVEEVIILPKNFYKVKINAVDYTPKEALGVLKRKTTESPSEGLIELSINQLKELDLDKEFWEIGSEIKKPEVMKGSIIYALKNEEKIVAIIIIQKKQIRVLQSIEKGYGTKIVNAIVKKLGNLKVKEAVRGAINFYYKMGFELDRNYLDTRNSNTINMRYHTKLSSKLTPKERIDNDVLYLEEEIKDTKINYDGRMQQMFLRPYINTLNILKK